MGDGDINYEYKSSVNDQRVADNRCGKPEKMSFCMREWQAQKRL